QNHRFNNERPSTIGSFRAQLFRLRCAEGRARGGVQGSSFAYLRSPGSLNGRALSSLRVLLVALARCACASWNARQRLRVFRPVGQLTFRLEHVPLWVRWLLFSRTQWFVHPSSLRLLCLCASLFSFPLSSWVLL